MINSIIEGLLIAAFNGWFWVIIAGFVLAIVGIITLWIRFEIRERNRNKYVRDRRLRI